MRDEKTQNEAALVCAAREGDKGALQLLLQCNWAWLRALTYGVLGDSQDIDDVMQDVCLRVIAKIDTLREPERFRAWLAVLARREALTYRRRRAPRPPAEEVQSASRQSGGLAEGPLDELERREFCSRIREAINGLPEKYREVFVLAHAGELTYAETAEILDVPVTTMQIRLVRARRMIRNQVTGTSEHKVHER